jgi:cytochrome c oxidase cbb3-type subunit 2
VLQVLGGLLRGERKTTGMNSGATLFLGLFVSMACSFLAFVLGPQLQIGNLAQTDTVVTGDASPQTYPIGQPGDAHQGAEIYRANGCTACHTQMVRPWSLGPDIQHGWGVRRSVAEDYLFEQPVLLGTQRIGPDLANFGRRSDLNGILFRLYDPRLITPRSLVPSYRFLFEQHAIQGAASPDALVLPAQIAPPAGYEVLARPQARALAAYLLSLRQDVYLFEAPPPPAPKTNAVPAATNSTAK